jgi:AraC-like DNA-binding protein
MTEPSDAIPAYRQRYASTNVGEIEAFLSGAYTHMSLRPAVDDRPLRFRHDTAALADFEVNRLSNTLGFDAEVAPLEHVISVADVHHGALTWRTTGHGEVHAVSGDLGLSPIRDEYSTAVDPSDFEVVLLDADRVRRYAAHHCGIDAETLAFDSLSPLSDKVASLWRATVAHVRDVVLADPLFSTNPIIVDGALRMLCSALLSTFPNTALSAASDPEGAGVVGDVPEAKLREVVDLLHHRAGEPVGPGDLAATADAPYREVTEGLRRRHGVHPAQMLWRARLDGVRRDLRAGDLSAGDSVAEIAARWGFTDPATFRNAYAHTTGESPDDTLRR